MAVNITAEQIHVWNVYVGLVNDWKDYILVIDPFILWAYWWVRAVKDTDAYGVYIWTSYIWTDRAIATALWLIFATAFAPFAYCPAAHSLASWYGTMIAEAAVRSTMPKNLVSSVCLAFAFIASVSAMATITVPSAFSPMLGVCASVPGMFISLFIGFAIGVLRVTFFVAVTQFRSQPQLLAKS